MSKQVGSIPQFEQDCKKRVKDLFSVSNVICYYDGSWDAKRDFVMEVKHFDDNKNWMRDRIKDKLKEAGATNIITSFRTDYLIDIAFNISNKRLKELTLTC